MSRGDALAGVAETRALPLPHLDEYQRVALAHDEIYLAEATAEIARDEVQPRRAEFLQGPVFCGASGGGGGAALVVSVHVVAPSVD